MIPVFCYLGYNNKFKKSVIFLAVVMLLLALVVGISDMLGGYDRYIYSELFDMLAEDYRNEHVNLRSSPIFLQYPKELGYTYLNLAISTIIQNRYIFILIVTFIIYTLLFVSFKEYFENYPFGLILFLGLWFFFSFTYLRQVLAASVGFLSVRYVIQRKSIKFFLLVALAFSFHNSAIILLPLYFFPTKKVSRDIVLIIMAACLLLGASGITTSLFSVWGSIADAEARSDKYSVEGSFRIAYFLEASCFLFFILKNYSVFNEKDTKNIVLLNMALVFCAILLFFIRSENGGRLSWFYMIGLIATLTHLVVKKPRFSNQNIVLLLLCGLLFLRILLQWGMLLRPYKTFFTSGHRNGDEIYEKYEYDANYDRDKFYK